MAEKVTTMVLTVDLHCCRCTKKIKKVLARFPEIRSQTYDEKKNTVTITVVCCSPEKIRAKLCCKAGKTIKSIEIREPEKRKEERKESNDKAEEDSKKTNEDEKSKQKKHKETPSGPVLVHGYPYPVLVCCEPCYVGNPGGPCFHGYRRPVPCCDGCGWNTHCYVSGCDEYFSEEHTSGCAIV